MKTKIALGNESKKLPHAKTAREDREETILTNRRKEDPRAGWKESFRGARSMCVKENLWGEIPLDEGWDS